MVCVTCTNRVHVAIRKARRWSTLPGSVCVCVRCVHIHATLRHIRQVKKPDSLLPVSVLLLLLCNAGPPPSSDA